VGPRQHFQSKGKHLIFKPEDGKNQLAVRMQMEDWRKLAVTVQ
jgi:hypothetical protein